MKKQEIKLFVGTGNILLKLFEINSVMLLMMGAIILFPDITQKIIPLWESSTGIKHILYSLLPLSIWVSVCYWAARAIYKIIKGIRK